MVSNELQASIYKDFNPAIHVEPTELIFVGPTYQQATYWARKFAQDRGIAKMPKAIGAERAYCSLQGRNPAETTIVRCGGPLPRGPKSYEFRQFLLRFTVVCIDDLAWNVAPNGKPE